MLHAIWFLSLTISTLGVVGTSQASERPNIVLVMADDMGWCDPSCFGEDVVATPNIDRIAEEGLRLTRYYTASAVCTPTRASVLTGKYPLRFDIQGHFTDQGEFLPTCETLPKLLGRAGYQTAHVGKWHLGGVREEDCSRRELIPGPREHGFDHYLTQKEQQPIRGKMGSNRTLYRKGGTVLLRDDVSVGPEDPLYDMYLTDLLAEESIRLIKEFSGDGGPFFLNLWWLTPHTPYEPAPEPHWSQTEEEGISHDQHCFRSMMARMDFNFGRILSTLDQLGIADATLIVFVSDNGGAWESNIGDLKGGKTDLHEGGIRVSAMVRWPGRIPPRSESSQLCHSTDLLPTLCAAAEINTPAEKFDGLNMLPVWTGQRDSVKRPTTFWQIKLYKRLQRHYPKPKPYATEIARAGRWKMLARDGQPVELFDIEADPLEERNVLRQESEVAESLQSELQAWLAEPRQPFGNSR